MYQDKVAIEARTALNSIKQKNKGMTIFDLAKLEPLNFIPYESACDPTYTARDILSTRSNEDVIKLSRAVDLMLCAGDELLHHLARKLLTSSVNRTAITISKGRALYLLCDYFDLKTVDLHQVQWSELFATLTLMLSAEISYMQTQSYTEFELSVGMDQNVGHYTNVIFEEIIDSIARAECLSDKSKIYSTAGSVGGEAKAKHIEPLKVEVINRYLTSYTSYSNKKAGEIIEAELNDEKHKSLLLSAAEEKNLQFAKWIGAFRKGQWKMPIQS